MLPFDEVLRRLLSPSWGEAMKRKPWQPSEAEMLTPEELESLGREMSEAAEYVRNAFQKAREDRERQAKPDPTTDV